MERPSVALSLHFEGCVTVTDMSRPRMGERTDTEGRAGKSIRGFVVVVRTFTSRGIAPAYTALARFGTTGQTSRGEYQVIRLRV